MREPLSARPGHHADGDQDGEDGRRRHEARRLRLRHQAVRRRRAARHPRQGDRERRARARGRGAAAPRSGGATSSTTSSAARRRCRRSSGRCTPWRRSRRRSSSPARAAPARSSSPRRSTTRARAPASRSSRSTAPPSPRRCSRASSSATRRARSPTPTQKKLGQFELAHERHALPRRDRRDGPVDAGEAPARARARRVPARRRPAAPSRVDVRIIAATNRDLAAGDQGRVVPRRPLLPAERRRGAPAAAARAARRPAPADPPLRHRQVAATWASPRRPSGPRRWTPCCATPGPATCASSRT